MKGNMLSTYPLHPVLGVFALKTHPPRCDGAKKTYGKAICRL
jgi:hypothetical protein